MKRYYAHYTFIYPETYLKNMVVEVDDDNKIVGIVPFEKEIEKTEFFSGILILSGRDILWTDFDLEKIKSRFIKEFNILTLNININIRNYNY